MHEPRMTLCSHQEFKLQCSWKLCKKIEYGNVVSFDATFGINQSNVCPFCSCMKCHIINMFHDIVTNVGVMFFTIPFVHLNGVWNDKMDTSCIHYHWKKSRK